MGAVPPVTPGASVGVVRRVSTVAKKTVMIAAAVAFAASGTLPLVGALNQSAQAAPGMPSSTLASGGQNYTAGDVSDSDLSRDAYSATSVVDIQTQLLQNKKARADSTYTGPTTADYLANPTYSTLDRSQVFAVALQYIGTPYVHGGEDPSAFDCSGLVTFVYSQFGISLPHWVPSQDAAGKRISQADAVPGDLVVFDNDAHDGIYAGNGMILDAPKPGGFVSVRPIWNQAHHFVRIGS